MLSERDNTKLIKSMVPYNIEASTVDLKIDEKTQVAVETMVPFGPVILRTKIPQFITDSFNDYCDGIIADKEKSRKNDFSTKLVGNVKQEFFIDKEFIEEENNMRNIISLMAERMVSIDVRGRPDNTVISYLKNAPTREVGVEATSITGSKILSMWCVSQYAGDFNPLHIHSGDLSGIFYLKLPEDMEEEYKKEDHFPCVGDIQFIAGTLQSFSRNNMQVHPSVGDMFLWPSWIHHTVYPFRTPNQERRSISFNLNYDVDYEKAIKKTNGKG